MFAVIFEVNPRPASWDDYLHHAAVLRPELEKIDGFLSNERFVSTARSGWLVSLSLWRDEAALIRWRTHTLHKQFQAKGRSEILAGYHLRVGEVIADTTAPGGSTDGGTRVTQHGESKFLTLTERSSDVTIGFDSLTRPGHGLDIAGWPDQAAAAAGTRGRPGHHRMVRVMRDYGMTDRVEAP